MLRSAGLPSFTCPVLVFVLTLDRAAQALDSTVVKVPGEDCAAAQAGKGEAL